MVCGTSERHTISSYDETRSFTARQQKETLYANIFPTQLIIPKKFYLISFFINQRPHVQIFIPNKEDS